MVIGTMQTQDPNKSGDVAVKNGKWVSGKEAVEVHLEINRRANYTVFESRDRIYHINGRPLCWQLHPQKDFKGRWRPALVSWDGESTDEILPTIKALGLDIERFLLLKKEYDEGREGKSKKLGKNELLLLVGIGVVAIGLACVALK